VSVTEDQRTPRTYEIDVGSAVHILDKCTSTGPDYDGLTTDGVESSHRGVNPAGETLLRTLEPSC